MVEVFLNKNKKQVMLNFNTKSTKILSIEDAELLYLRLKFVFSEDNEKSISFGDNTNPWEDGKSEEVTQK